MAGLDASNILLNGNFTAGLDDWNVTDISGESPPVVNNGNVRFNNGDDPVFGDAIDQTFATVVGNTYSLTLTAVENGSGVESHSFTADILDDAGNVVETISATVEDGESGRVIGFTFEATSTASTIVITNTSSTGTVNSDLLIDNVRVIDISGGVSLQGGSSADLIFGGAGDDTINGGNGRDTLDGGAGNDNITSTGNPTIFVGGEGADTMVGATTQDVADYSASSAGIEIDVPFSGPSAAGIGGDAEGDILEGIHNIIGSEFDDVIRSNGNKITLQGLGGDDFIRGGFSNTDRLFGGDGDDTLVAARGGDTLNGGNGNDLLFGNRGLVDGGDGLDTLSFIGSDGNRAIVLNLVDPTLNTRAATNMVIENIEIIEATIRDDQLTGDADDNHFIGAEGADTISGGDGVDTASYVTSEARVEVDLTTGLGTAGDASGDVLDTIENIIGSAFNDFIVGDIAANGFEGGDGNDNMNGLGGADLLNGGLGNDLLSGGNENDTLIGGDGDDRLAGNGGDDSLSGGEGVDSLFGGTGDDTLLGGSGNDSILGQSGADQINGGGGEDILRGGSGNDLLEGGADDDDLFGNGNNDTLDGGGGDDLLQGGSGSDELIGGFGNDTLSAGDGGDRLDGGQGNDLMNGGIADGARDTFVFLVGYDQDRINAFDQAGTDRLELDEDLWLATEGVLTAQEAVDLFGTLNASSTILTLDFGAGDILEVQNGGGIDQSTLGLDVVII